MLPRIEGERLVYLATEPHFVLEENVEDDIGKNARNHIANVTEAIALEMVDVYKMRLSGSTFFRQLTFPKDVYARRIQRFTVPVLLKVTPKSF